MGGAVAALAQAEVLSGSKRVTPCLQKTVGRALGADPSGWGSCWKRLIEPLHFHSSGPRENLGGTHGHSGTEGPDLLKTTTDEIRYLLDSCRRYFPIVSRTIRWDHRGGPSLLGQKGPEKLLSRGFRVMDHGREGGAGTTGHRGRGKNVRLSAHGGRSGRRRLPLDRNFRRRPNRRDGAGWETCRGDRFGGASFRQTEESFLDLHPRCGSLHALAHLGLAYVRHMFSRTKRNPRGAT
jgi:hypothetical protein